MQIDKATIDSFFEQVKEKLVLVIGDVMVDSYIWGNVSRISPEAPVPIVAVEKRENMLGGAANVALNINSLEAHPLLCSVVGQDEKGTELLRLMNDSGLTTEGIVTSSKRITTTKFRVIGNNHQLIRVDEEVSHDLDDTDIKALWSRIESIIKSRPIAAIVFQDYNKGVITENLIRRVIDLAQKHRIPVAVDPKRKNFDQYKGVSLFKPNLKELSEGINKPVAPVNKLEFEAAAINFQKLHNIDFLLITLSEKGIFGSKREENGEYNCFYIPSFVRKVADVSGAGDTVISVASLCLSCNLSPFHTAVISNTAGGLVCESVGVVPVNRKKLIETLLSQ